MSASEKNRDTYDALWPRFSDFIRYNPGARHRRAHVFALLDRLSFRSLLDVGCGDATLLRQIDARYPGTRLTGVDISAVVVEANRRAHPHITFAVNDIERDPLPGPVDVITCCEVLEHLDHPDVALSRITAALPPGGHAVITVPTGTVHATERHFGHVRHPTPQEFVRLAQGAGLDVVTLHNWGFPMYALTKWATNLKPEAALARFGGDRAYGPIEKGVSLALWLANFANLESSPLGVQIFALLRKRDDAPKEAR